MVRLIILLAVSANILLSAQEAATQKSAEGGLVHSKQKGRYKVLKQLPQKAESFDNSFDYARPFGTFRTANITTQHDALTEQNIEVERKGATAFGGIFGFETASLHGLRLHVGAYVSQKIASLTAANQNDALFNAKGDSYTYIGEASVAYETDTIQAKVGRIRLDTPYADSDDIRMSPNSFEGASLHAQLSDAWQTDAYMLTRWAGTDSEQIDLFTELVDGGYGLAGGAVTYSIDEENEVSLWYYNVDRESDIIYVEAAADMRFNEDFHMEWGLQGAHIMERSDSDVEGDVLGGMLIADLGYVYGGLSCNYVFEDDNNTITDGFGGGPYYTSLDEQTIGSISALTPGHDLFVYRLALGLNFSGLGAKDLSVEFVHGHFLVEDSPVDAQENDLALTYGITKRWYFESIYTKVSLDNIEFSAGDPEETFDFQRLVTRLDYKF